MIEVKIKTGFLAGELIEEIILTEPLSSFDAERCVELVIKWGDGRRDAVLIEKSDARAMAAAILESVHAKK